MSVWDPGTAEDPRLLAKLDGPHATEKLEGIAVLPASSNSGKVDLLLTIDGQKNGSAPALPRGLSVLH